MTTTTQPAAKRGNNITPAGQLYRVRPSRKIKRATEAFKRMVNLSRLTPKQRSMLAFFAVPQGRDSN